MGVPKNAIEAKTSVGLVTSKSIRRGGLAEACPAAFRFPSVATGVLSHITKNKFFVDT
jgi:hypothetical protein